MKIDYNVKKFKYDNRYRNLTAKAQSKVKSEKFFPVFLDKEKEYIFKPLSKTKPLTTPFFAYAEVIWSHIVKNYFCKNAPLYNLAYCEGYQESVSKYYNIGTIVSSVVDADEKLVNLYEYFTKNKDYDVNIDGYTNYCMKDYDYTSIFNSRVFSENKDLGEELAMQVLLSILRADQNFHYENVSFIYKDGKLLSLSPCLDYEFSSMFLFLDKLESNKFIIDEYIKKMKNEDLIDKDSSLYKVLESKNMLGLLNPISLNIDFIVQNYPNIVKAFLDKLQLLLDDISKSGIILEDKNYIIPFNSDNYKIGEARYKENDEKKAEAISKSLNQCMVDLSLTSKLITNHIIKVGNALIETLSNKLDKSKINTYKKDSKESLNKYI